MYRCGNNNRKKKQGAIKRRNCWRHIALLAPLCTAQLSSTWLGFLLLPTTSSSSDPCTAPLLFYPHNPSHFPVFFLKLCVFICGILRIYLFWLFYNIAATASLSQPPSPLLPVTPSRQCNLSISYTFRHTPSSALPHSSNAVATSVTRFSLFPFQFFRCVLWQLSACSRCSFFLPLCSSTSSSTCCCCAF